MRCGWRGRSWIKLATFRRSFASLRHEIGLLTAGKMTGPPRDLGIEPAPRARGSPPPSAGALRRCRSGPCAPANTLPAPGSARRTTAASDRTRFPSARGRRRARLASAACARQRRPRSRYAPTAGSRRRRRRSARRNIRASSPVRTRKPGGLRRNRSIDCARLAPQSFMPTMLGCPASSSSVSFSRLTPAR